MPLRFLRGTALRFTLTVFALACGVALVCAIDLVNRATLQAFTEVVDTMAGRAALQVIAGQGGLLAEDVASTVAAVSDVELAVPVVSAAAFMTDGSGEQLAIHGVDITNDAAVRSYEPAGGDAATVEDPLVFLSQPDSVILTQEFATRRGLNVGDKLELDTPSGRRHFTIRELLASQGVARVRGGNLVIMDIAAAEVAFTKPTLVNRVDIVVHRDADVDRVADAITALLPPGLSVERPAQRKVDLQKVILSGQMIAQTVGWLGLLAAFLIAFSRLTNVFEQRTARLAVLRAVGVRAGRVWWELAKESLIVAAAGVTLGIPLGIGIAHLILPIGSAALEITSKLPLAEADVAVRPVSLVLAAALGFLAVFLAAALPAWRAAQVSVAETLRQRGTEQEDGPGRTPWLLRGLVMTTALVAFALHLLTGSAGVGLVASALLVTVGALIARPLSLTLRSPLGSAIAARGPTTRMAFATLMRNPRRTALAIATIGVGLGTVFWLWTIARSFEDSIAEVMPGVLRGDLAVSSSNLSAGYVEAPVSDDLVSELRRLSGIQAVAGEEVADVKYGGGPISLNAFDREYFSESAFGRWPLVGRRLPGLWDAVARGEAAIVSENFVRNLGVNVGDNIVLDTPSGPLVIRVAGVTRDFLSPRGTVELSREVYARYWHDSHIIRALVKIAPGTDVQAVRDTIARELGRTYSLQILSLGALVDWFTSQARRAFGFLHVLAALVLVVVLLGVGDTLGASIVERTRELGIIRAVGVRRRRLSRLVVTEAVVLAALGLTLAWSIGLVLGTVWVRWTFPALLGWTLSLHLPFEQLVGIAVVAIAACLAAAVVPARRAARLDPVAALRAE